MIREAIENSSGHGNAAALNRFRKPAYVLIFSELRRRVHSESVPETA
jgi:hypothetical protein